MIDLEEQFNFTNKLKHPTNQTKVVYRHYNKASAETFATLLVDNDIDFEAQVDEDDERKPTYFGVSRSIEKKVDQLNFKAIGAHREKFIASPPVRWMIILIGLGTLLVAIIGAMISK